MRITNLQKKELSEIFNSSGLNLFDFDTSGEYKEFKIKFKHDYFSFYINIEKSNIYYINYFSISNTKGVTRRLSWADVKKIFDKWTKDISTELNTPTGWETFENSRIFNNNSNDINEEFTQEEKDAIKTGIEELIKLNKGSQLSESSIEIIQIKLIEISNKIDVLNKFDWQSLLIGTIANLIMVLAIPPEASGIIWEHLKSVFRFKIKG